MGFLFYFPVCQEISGVDFAVAVKEQCSFEECMELFLTEKMETFPVSLTVAPSLSNTTIR